MYVLQESIWEYLDGPLREQIQPLTTFTPGFFADDKLQLIGHIQHRQVTSPLQCTIKNKKLKIQYQLPNIEYSTNYNPCNTNDNKTLFTHYLHDFSMCNQVLNRFNHVIKHHIWSDTYNTDRSRTLCDIRFDTYRNKHDIIYTLFTRFQCVQSSFESIQSCNKISLLIWHIQHLPTGHKPFATYVLIYIEINMYM